MRRDFNLGEKGESRASASPVLIGHRLRGKGLLLSGERGTSPALKEKTHAAPLFGRFSQSRGEKKREGTSSMGKGSVGP